nr:hypothetical protein [Tanacetum cinerariifolium]
MRNTSAHTRYERVSKMSSDSLLVRVNTPQSDEDRLKHIELMKIYTTLQKKVLDLEVELKRTKTAQQIKNNGLERRVKKLEKKHMSRTHKLKRLYKVGLTARVISSFDDEALDKEDAFKQERIDKIDADEVISLVSTYDDELQDECIEYVVTTAIADIPVSAAEAIVTTTPTITAESTKTNVEVTQASKRKGVMIQELEETTTIKTASSQQPLTAEKRNKPPTKAQQRRIMSTYLKNMDGWKLSALKNKSFAEIKELFAKAMKRINNFIDFKTKLVEVSKRKDEAEETQESSSKRVGDEIDQETSKKQNVDDDKESAKLKKCFEILPDDGDDVTIDVIPLSSKPPIIVDYKIYKKGTKTISKFP